MSHVSPFSEWNKIDFHQRTPSYFGDTYVRFSERDDTLHLFLLRTEVFLPSPELAFNRRASVLPLCYSTASISFPVLNAGGYSSIAEVVQGNLTAIYKIAHLIFSNM